jgi:hypothetical protein
MMPVKPGVLSRISSISCRIDSSERLWMMRPSCSVIEQKVQPPKQPRMMLIEKRIISKAGIFASPYDGCGRRWKGEAKTPSISGVDSGNRRRIEPHVAFAVRLDQRARVARIRLDVEGARGVRVEHRVGGDLLVRRQANRRARPLELRHALVRLELHLDHLRAAVRRWPCHLAALAAFATRTGGLLAALRVIA